MLSPIITDVKNMWNDVGQPRRPADQRPPAAEVLFRWRNVAPLAIIAVNTWVGTNNIQTGQVNGDPSLIDLGTQQIITGLEHALYALTASNYRDAPDFLINVSILTAMHRIAAIVTR